MATTSVAGVKRNFSSISGPPADLDFRRSTGFPFDHGGGSRSRRSSPRLSASANESRGLTSSSRNSPAPRSSSGPDAFEPDASIVLVGIRGSGKSTLAIIASTAMERKIIDTEKLFHEATGLSSIAFKKKHGSGECQHRQYDVLQKILTMYPTDVIIVCSWMERSILASFQDFAASHPVVHITRDVEAIQDHLKVADEAKMRELHNYTAKAFRDVANFEFFNMTEDLPKQGNIGSGDVGETDYERKPAPYLTLKRAERHFLKFLTLIMPKKTIPFIESAFPLASIPTETRRFTYAVSLPIKHILSQGLNIEDLENGADAIEIVIDDIRGLTPDSLGTDPGHLSPEAATQISRALSHLRRNVVIPIIFHVAWPGQDSPTAAQQSLYVECMQHGLRLAPEYITVDLRLDDQIFSRFVDARLTSKIIGTVHLGTATPPSWKAPIWTSYYRKAQALSCDLVRMTRPAIQLEDNFEINCLFQALEDCGQPRLPLIAFNTGPKGRNSACFNHKLTSTIPESLMETIPEDDGTGLFVRPSITAQQATAALISSFIYDPMKIFVIGAYVSYSMSPAMHNAALKACGMPHNYQPYSTNSLSSIRHVIHDPYFAGASIGLPYKVEVISLTHSLSSHAKAIGAVNTLIPVRNLNPDGSIPDDALFFNQRNRAGPVLALYGDNTDWIGIRACIRRGLSPANAVRPTSTGLVIGAGGMARAAVYAMLQLGVKNIAIYNRTRANAEKMVAHFSRLLARHDLPLLSKHSDNETTFHVLNSLDQPWPDHLRPPTMMVSCIPTHDIGENKAPHFTMPTDWLKSPTGGVCIDYAYKILNTPLLEQMRGETHRGWVPMDGLDLLPEQGFAQFELFTGRRAPRRLMRGEVFRAYPQETSSSTELQLKPRLENITDQEP